MPHDVPLAQRAVAEPEPAAAPTGAPSATPPPTPVPGLRADVARHPEVVADVRPDARPPSQDRRDLHGDGARRVLPHVLHAYDEAEEMAEVVGSPNQPGAAALRATLEQTIALAFDAEPFRPAVGDPLDPALHHICVRYPIDDPSTQRSGTVAQVLDTGFRTHSGEVLRRSAVTGYR